MGRKISNSCRIKILNPTVASHGYGSANILFVAGFPLKADLNNGIALSGSNEETLNQFLRSERLNIKHTYRSLYIREKLDYSGTNSRRLREALKKVDTEGYKQLLFDEIHDLNPNVIVPLDDIALSVVFPHINAIKKPKGRRHWMNCYRGSILPFNEDWQAKHGYDKPIKVIPTFGPQYLYSDWKSRAYVRVDYERIAKYSKTQDVFKEPGILWVTKTYESLLGFVSRQYAKLPTRVSFDVETYGGMLTCISFCFDGEEAVSVPLAYNDAISMAEKVLLWKLVSQILADPRTEKNNQNIKYDWTILERHGFIVDDSAGISDTMIKAGLLYPELLKGLDFLTSIYTEIPYYKDEGKNFDPRMGKDRLYLYNAKDALAAHLVAEAQDIELKELETA